MVVGEVLPKAPFLGLSEAYDQAHQACHAHHVDRPLHVQAPRLQQELQSLHRIAIVTNTKHLSVDQEVTMH